MFRIEIDAPEFELVLQKDGALMKAGTFLAEIIKERIRNGRDADGHPLPGSSPLHKSGELLASIKPVLGADNETVTVGPTGDRARVARVLANPGKKKRHALFDAFSFSDEELGKAVDEYETAIDLELR